MSVDCLVETRVSEIISEPCGAGDRSLHFSLVLAFCFSRPSDSNAFLFFFAADSNELLFTFAIDRSDIKGKNSICEE